MHIRASTSLWRQLIKKPKLAFRFFIRLLIAPYICKEWDSVPLENSAFSSVKKDRLGVLSPLWLLIRTRQGWGKNQVLLPCSLEDFGPNGQWSNDRHSRFLLRINWETPLWFIRTLLPLSLYHSNQMIMSWSTWIWSNKMSAFGLVVGDWEDHITGQSITWLIWLISRLHVTAG